MYQMFLAVAQQADLQAIPPCPFLTDHPGIQKLNRLEQPNQQWTDARLQRDWDRSWEWTISSKQTAPVLEELKKAMLEEITRQRAATWAGRLQRTAKDAVKANAFNAKIYAMHHPLLTDRFARDITNDRPMLLPRVAPAKYTLREDHHVSQFHVDLCIATGLSFTEEAARQASDYQASKNPRNVLLELLEAVPQWNKQDNIPHFVRTFIKADADDTEVELMKKWLIGAVRRLKVPGSKNENMLILHGDQGIGKNWLIDVLSMGAVNQNPPHPSDKDFIAQTTNSWIVMFDEFTSMYNKADVDAFKSFLSTSEDDKRLSYRHDSKRILRRQAYVATTNEAAFLRDNTGNRRFWPLHMTENIIERLDEMRACVPQVWAEAIAREAAGEDNFFLKEQTHLTNLVRMEDPLKDSIENMLEASNGRPFSFADVLEFLQKTNRDSFVISSILRALGCHKKRGSFPGSKTKHSIYWKGDEEPDKNSRFTLQDMRSGHVQGTAAVAAGLAAVIPINTHTTKEQTP